MNYDPKLKADVYEYTLENIPARSQDRYTPGPSHVYPHILVIAKSFEQKNKKTPLFGSAEDLYRWYSSLVRDMKDDTSVLNDKVAELTKDAKTDQEKVEAIYYWVQDNVRYIAFEDGIAGFRRSARVQSRHLPGPHATQLLALVDGVRHARANADLHRRIFGGAFRAQVRPLQAITGGGFGERGAASYTYRAQVWRLSVVLFPSVFRR